MSDRFSQNPPSLAPPVAGASRQETLRHGAANVISAIYRLLRTARLHESDNVVMQHASGMATAAQDLCRLVGALSVTIFFAGDIVFVNGQMLKVARDTHAVAMGLAEFLQRCNANEISIDTEIAPQDALQTARALIGAVREPSLLAALKEALPGCVRLRKVKVMSQGESETPVDRAVRTYASGVVTLRQLYASMRSGEAKRLPQAIKRIAQRIVVMSSDDPHLLIALTATRGSEPDEALTALNTALLGVLAARLLTADRMTLASVAMSAMLWNVGRVRLLTRGGADAIVERDLDEAETRRLPASAVIALAPLWRVHASSMLRTVMSYESLWLHHATALGSPYAGRKQPLVFSRIVERARAYNERMVPTLDRPAPQAVDVIAQMLAEAGDDHTDKALVQLLGGALGIFPVGTAVELNTGETAVVTGAPVIAVDFARPPIRVTHDAQGRLLDKPFDIDLAAPPPAGQQIRCIRRALAADHERAKISASLRPQAPSGSFRPRPAKVSRQSELPTVARAPDFDVLDPVVPSDRLGPAALDVASLEKRVSLGPTQPILETDDSPTIDVPPPASAAPALAAEDIDVEYPSQPSQPSVSDIVSESQSSSSASSSASSGASAARRAANTGDVHETRVGALLKGKWRLDALLGTGAMAAVYSATHRNGQRAAIKVLHPEASLNKEILQRFMRESYVSNQVKHPVCVAVLDDDVTDDGESYLVMELLEGQTLRDVWKRMDRRIPVAQALSIVDEVLDCLKACHAIGVVHRDLKPANVFVTTSGAVKLLDFGVAQFRSASSDRTALGTMIGTPGYMSPEQALGRVDQVDGRADIFAVGALLHMLITGHRIHQSRNAAEGLLLAAKSPVPTIAKIAPDLHPSVVALIDKALAYERTNRFQTAGQMQEAVRAALAALGAMSASAAKIPAASSAGRFPEQEAPSLRNVAMGADSPATAPTARGTLGTTPLVNVLVYVLDKALTGTLVVREGHPDAATIVIERGVVTRVRKGEALVESEARGIAASLATLVNLPADATYAFYEGQDRLSQWPSLGAPAHPLAALMACARAWNDRARMSAVALRLGGTSITLDPRSKIAEADLSPAESSVVEALRRGARGIDDVRARTLVAEERLVPLVYVLVATRQVARSGEKVSPMGA